MPALPNPRRRRPKFRNFFLNGMTFLTGMCIGVLLPYHLLYPSAFQNVRSKYVDLLRNGTNDNDNNSTRSYLTSLAEDTVLVSISGTPRTDDIDLMPISKTSRTVDANLMPISKTSRTANMDLMSVSITAGTVDADLMSRTSRTGDSDLMSVSRTPRAVDTDLMSISSDSASEYVVGGLYGSPKERTFFATGPHWAPMNQFPTMFLGIGSERLTPSTSSDRYIHEPGVDALLPATAAAAAAASERPVAPGRTSRASFSGMRLGLPAVQRRPNSSAAAAAVPRHHTTFLQSRPDHPGSSSSSSSAVPISSKIDHVDLVSGVYWTETAEKFVPAGFGDVEINEWRKFLNVTPVLKVQEGCGRMQNRLVTFEDGRKSCCRYRHNNDQIQGEIFSFYLGRILGIGNLVPSALALVDTRESRWSAASSQVSLAQWSSERPVVLTQFVEDLLPAYIPKHFQVKGHRRLHPIREDLGNLTSADITDLVQWSDLVIFDYLTANLDRVVNNMYNERWNAEMMRQPTHNLARTKDGLLLFLDNESGLLHGYRLLEKYENFHQSLLDGLCLFRRSTVKALADLQDTKSVEKKLKTAFFNGDPGMSEWLPFLPDKNIRTLKKRLAAVHDHIISCQSRFGLPEDRPVR